MDSAVFGDVTVMRLLLWAGGAVVVLVAIAILRRLLGGTKQSQHRQNAACPRCGWKGQVSRYAGKCPKCNGPLGDKLASGRRA